MSDVGLTATEGPGRVSGSDQGFVFWVGDVAARSAALTSDNRHSTVWPFTESRDIGTAGPLTGQRWPGRDHLRAELVR